MEQGFDFLVQHLRKFGGKFLAIPSKSSVKGIVSKTKKIIKAHLGSTTAEMLRVLNPVIRGWANYHRHACSKKAFNYVDSRIFNNLWKWAKRRHPHKKAQWIQNRYFRSIGNRNWCFFATNKTEKGGTEFLDLVQMSAIRIVRHTKIRGKANPYDIRWQGYFSKRSWGTYNPAIRSALCW